MKLLPPLKLNVKTKFYSRLKLHLHAYIIRKEQVWILTFLNPVSLTNAEKNISLLTRREMWEQRE